MTLLKGAVLRHDGTSAAQPRRRRISEDVAQMLENAYVCQSSAFPYNWRRFSVMITYTFVGREHLRSSSEILSRKYFLQICG
jgi:hypothetical protein